MTVKEWVFKKFESKYNTKHGVPSFHMTSSIMSKFEMDRWGAIDELAKLFLIEKVISVSIIDDAVYYKPGKQTDEEIRVVINFMKEKHNEPTRLR